MPVIFYSSINKLSSLDKDPYASFTKKFRSLKSIDGQEIELQIDNGKEGFYKGFYTDDCYMESAKLTFTFATMNSSVNFDDKAYFIRMVYSFECNDDNFRHYQNRISVLKKRVPYFYIPEVSNFEFSSYVDDRFQMQFDVLLKNENAILQVCHSLINQIITIFSFED